MKEETVLSSYHDYVAHTTPHHTHTHTHTHTCAHTHTHTQNISPSDELLSSVRAELDKSITRHLDMATGKGKG